ncbi:MAG: adenylyltransferase/cytidyltransferase family protein [Microscillaceae bacterium]|nr:adenylyltransferase/cytidyltransferase family protein [Microscillaceae bacterium]
MKAIYQTYLPVLQSYGVQNLETLISQWQEPHRYYHNEDHLSFLLEGIEKLAGQGELSPQDKASLIMTAFFHDVIYDPTRQDNEEKSADFFVQNTDNQIDTEQIRQMILDTKKHEAQSKLSEIFIDLDMWIVTHADFLELLDYEYKIFKEYQFFDYAVYKPVRISLLQQFAQKFPQNAVNLHHLVDYLQKHRPKIGIYPGSFNPLHNGHLNILEKAEKIFDKVIVARGINPDKMDINTEKLALEVLKYRQFENFSGFLTQYINTKETYCDVTLVRGLRNGDDLDYEVNQLRFMEEMKPDLKIIFITCDKEFEHISSSAIKNLDRIDPNFSAKYRPQ